MMDNEFQRIVTDIRQSIGKMIGTSGENVFVIKGTIVLAIESVFRNFLMPSSRILLVGNAATLQYIEYICDVCQLQHDSIYVNGDVLPLIEIEGTVNKQHYEAIYLPYSEMNTGVLYNINTLRKSITNMLLIVNIGNSILMNPINIVDDEIDIAIGEIPNGYSFVGISPKIKQILTEKEISYFINYSSFQEYLDKMSVYLNEYRSLDNKLKDIQQLSIQEWQSYFTYLVSYMRMKLKMLGYTITPTENFSNSHIILEVSDAQTLCDKLFEEYHVLVYSGYGECDNTHIVIDMTSFVNIKDCLRLLRGLDELCLK